MVNLIQDITSEQYHICSVRLSTSYWNDGNGVYLKKSLKYLKRKCVGYNILHEDCCNIDPEEVLTSITNLYTVPDGVYTISIINEYVDWETNTIQDYDYKLEGVI